MSYKIEVTSNANCYEYSLFKRKFFGWKKISWDVDFIPYGKKVLEWREKYNVTDRRISFINLKK